MQVAIMSAIRHPNVVLFMGVCLDPPCMVTEVSKVIMQHSVHDSPQTSLLSPAVTHVCLLYNTTLRCGSSPSCIAIKPSLAALSHVLQSLEDIACQARTAYA